MSEMSTVIGEKFKIPVHRRDPHFQTSVSARVRGAGHPEGTGRRAFEVRGPPLSVSMGFAHHYAAKER